MDVYIAQCVKAVADLAVECHILSPLETWSCSCPSGFEEAFLTHTKSATELTESEMQNLKLWCPDPYLSQFPLMTVHLTFVTRMPLGSCFQSSNKETRLLVTRKWWQGLEIGRGVQMKFSQASQQSKNQK